MNEAGRKAVELLTAAQEAEYQAKLARQASTAATVEFLTHAEPGEAEEYREATAQSIHDHSRRMDSLTHG